MKYVNTCKKLILALLYCQNPKHLLNYTNNMSHVLDKHLNNNKEDIR